MSILYSKQHKSKTINLLVFNAISTFFVEKVLIFVFYYAIMMLIALVLQCCDLTFADRVVICMVI